MTGLDNTRLHSETYTVNGFTELHVLVLEKKSVVDLIGPFAWSAIDDVRERRTLSAQTALKDTETRYMLEGGHGVQLI